MNHQKSDNSVLILGMHRSGTSCLAGCLQEAGLHLGDVETSSPFNKKGNRERKIAMQLHESVLRGNGGNWHNPPAKIQWDKEQLDQLDALIATYPAAETWGIKDPRLLLMLDVWLDRLPSPQRVASIRNPLSVVRSLQARHPNFAEETLFELYSIYNQRLIDLWKSSRFSIVNFDCSAAHYGEQIYTLVEQLGLPGRQSGDLQFFDDSLRQPQFSDASIPPHISSLYEELRAMAEA